MEVLGLVLTIVSTSGHSQGPWRLTMGIFETRERGRKERQRERWAWKHIRSVTWKACQRPLRRTLKKKQDSLHICMCI